MTVPQRARRPEEVAVSVPKPQFAEQLVRWAIDSGNEWLLPIGVRVRHTATKRPALGSNVRRRVNHAT